MTRQNYLNKAASPSGQTADDVLCLSMARFVFVHLPEEVIKMRMLAVAAAIHVV
jgi:hypothetical protein